MSEQCKNQATLRFTWPGRDESYICNSCADKADAVAQAMGLHLQFLPVGAEESQQCRQQVNAKRGKTI